MGHFKNGIYIREDMQWFEPRGDSIVCLRSTKTTPGPQVLLSNGYYVDVADLNDNELNLEQRLLKKISGLEERIKYLEGLWQ